MQLDTSRVGYSSQREAWKEANSLSEDKCLFPRAALRARKSLRFLYESSSRQAGVRFVFQNLFKRCKIFHQPSGRRLKRPGKAEYFPLSAKLYACR